MSSKLIKLISALLVASWSQISSASVILEYVGNNFDRFREFGLTTPPDNYQAGDRVTARIELSYVLAPNLVNQSFTFTIFSLMDGLQTIDNTSATSSWFVFSTDANGLPIWWIAEAQIFSSAVGGKISNYIATYNSTDDMSYVGYQTDSGSVDLCGPSSVEFSCADFGDPFYSLNSDVRDNPGVWSYRQSDPSPVPAPTTLALFGMGFLVLSAFKRKKV